MKSAAIKEMSKIVPKHRFSTAREDKICYACDASRIKKIPLGVVFPQTLREVSEILKIANKHKIPVYPRGAGSGMTGGAVPCEKGIVISMELFNKILHIDTDNLYAEVEPAVVTHSLQQRVESLGLFYPPDPASMKYASIGGNIAENSGGMRAVKYGVTKDYVMGLEVVLATGEIIHTGSCCVKDVVGYNMSQLFVGSEGTLGIITKAILKLLPKPESKSTFTATFPSMVKAAEAVSFIIKKKIIPTTLEFLDQHCIRAVEKRVHIGLPENAKAFLLIEIDGEPKYITETVKKVEEICMDHHCLDTRIATDPAEQEKLWLARRSVSPSLQNLGKVRLSEDIVVPRSKIPQAIEKMDRIARRLGILIITFGHAGDGNIHVNIISDEEPAVLQGVDEVFRAIVHLGGRISGEHGIGLTKRKWTRLNLDEPTINAMKSIKSALDPNNILNPNKIFMPESQ
ncbi:FAD-binding oxidoreductase [Desulfospira joergensenii]|uniref:FAD-binding oxidoreductase n=1 Tax=Desulfospira joergensenii TaxID=53329 RepID=UPI0003B441D2|nr:FAD-linked oxidase C-terminal domain-containing protein [Desulfospira joergensenii]